MGMGENWKDISGYEGLYQVSDMGRVKSICSHVRLQNGELMKKKPHILKPQNRCGYRCVNLFKDGSIHTVNIHRLVAESFLPNPHNYPVVNHKDENKTNNNVGNLEFNARPTYSYKVIKNRAIDVVFDNKHIDKADTESGKDGFMQSLEDNILEPRIYDLIKEESRKHKTDSLMADGGSLLFEKRLEQIVDKEFEKRGLQLLTFSAQLEFSKAVREKIDSRNEVNTNISVLDQQIAEQKKRNELEQLKTEQAIIQSRGLTKEILYKQFIDKWDGRTPLYGIAPEFLKITK